MNNWAVMRTIVQLKRSHDITFYLTQLCFVLRQIINFKRLHDDQQMLWLGFREYLELLWFNLRNLHNFQLQLVEFVKNSTNITSIWFKTILVSIEPTSLWF